MFRRAKNYDAGEKFLGRTAKRRRTDDPSTPERTAPAGGETAWGEGEGPRDVTTVDPSEMLEAGTHLDLGSLLLKIPDDAELRIPVSDETGDVLAALLLRPESAAEITVFAAPRSGGQWSDVADEITEQTESSGGTCERADTSHGIELRLRVPGRHEGREVMQEQRLWGFDGPRWMMRVSLVGKAATDDVAAAEMLAYVAEAVVVRGSEPMSPREPLPLRLPESATVVDDGSDNDGGSERGDHG